ncbi:MAG: nucleotidyltransferase family protein, partial [Deltaproteobacteria bacterium]|nr:nucleotidyltransferase family protein [Deltaproteobacteria bacterium]
MSVEFRLLLACARANPAPDDEAEIRAMLIDGVDWTHFVRTAIRCGLAGLAGHALMRVAADLVPDEILEAFLVTIDRTREQNRVLLDTALGVIDALRVRGIEAIPFNGPILAIDAYGDLGLRRLSGHLDLFIRAPDLSRGISCIRSLGYERKKETFRHADGSTVTLRTRLVPMVTAIDTDDGGLWRRKQPKMRNGRTVLTLAPEDALLVLAVRGGREGWGNIRRACDVAAFIGSYPGLAWNGLLDNAQARACRFMFLLAMSIV